MGSRFLYKTSFTALRVLTRNLATVLEQATDDSGKESKFSPAEKYPQVDLDKDDKEKLQICPNEFYV